jgi:hypothetical protein
MHVICTYVTVVPRHIPHITAYFTGIQYHTVGLIANSVAENKISCVINSRNEGLYYIFLSMQQDFII